MSTLVTHLNQENLIAETKRRFQAYQSALGGSVISIDYNIFGNTILKHGFLLTQEVSTFLSIQFPIKESHQNP